MNLLKIVGASFAALAMIACSKKEPAETSTASATAASASETAATPKAAAAPEPERAASFTGTYTVTVGTMYVPDGPDFKSVKFKNDETKLLGEGKLSLTIGPSGRIEGASEGGPLGDAIFEGTRDDDRVTAQVSRKDAADQGLTGTLIGTREGDAIHGTMKLSEWNAAVVREATFRATRAPN